jgi:hypothetical protein
LRYRTARRLLMASQIPTQQEQDQVQGERFGSWLIPLPIHKKRSRQRLADASPKAGVTITGN